VEISPDDLKAQPFGDAPSADEVVEVWQARLAACASVPIRGQTSAEFSCSARAAVTRAVV
jgi:hypothetical protein